MMYSVIKKYQIAMTLTRKIAIQGCIFLSLLRHSVSYIIYILYLYIHYTRDRHVESHGHYKHDQLVTDIFHLASTSGLRKNSMSEYCEADLVVVCKPLCIIHEVPTILIMQEVQALV